jgi:hypothetical protein
MFDFGNMPVAGGVLAAGLFYAGASLFVTGPLVGERMVAKMDWAHQCARHIRAEAQSSAGPAMPKIGCNELFGMWLGRDGERFCQVLDKSPIGQALHSAGEGKREMQERRFEYAAARAGSRCECAVSTTLENRRVPLAIYAGTARLVTPPSVKLLQSDLVSSLNAPSCAAKG